MPTTSSGLRFKEETVSDRDNLKQPGLSIGTLAAEAQCSVSTIRYYEEISLLPQPQRRGGRHRIYGSADLRRLTFIRRCRDVGFSIEQVRELVSVMEAPEHDCTAARDVAQMHLNDVREKLEGLRALERSLRILVDTCTARCAGGPASACVMLVELATPD
jgi:DNA-binding transcriptional MerR regulator